jgi:hypothetical protein
LHHVLIGLQVRVSSDKANKRQCAGQALFRFDRRFMPRYPTVSSGLEARYRRVAGIDTASNVSRSCAM